VKAAPLEKSRHREGAFNGHAELGGFRALGDRSSSACPRDIARKANPAALPSTSATLWALPEFGARTAWDPDTILEQVGAAG